MTKPQPVCSIVYATSPVAEVFLIDINFSGKNHRKILDANFNDLANVRSITPRRNPLLFHELARIHLSTLP
jgi:hypothetical protein